MRLALWNRNAYVAAPIQPKGVPATFTLVLSIVLLIAVLAVAIARPRRVPEIAIAGPAALLLLALSIIPWSEARASTTELFPVVAFLATALALSEACRREGLFEAAGALLQTKSRGKPKRLFALTFAMAAIVTALLSLDATVVLLTPVVLHAAGVAGLRKRPVAYATGHLANSASLLLPVSNLTNLLAYRQSGLTFVGFGGRMLAPWIVVLIVEYVGLRILLSRDFNATVTDTATVQRPLPRFAAITVVMVLVGFAVTSPLGIEPAWVAGAGALVLTVKALAQSDASVVDAIRSMHLSFCAFVLALGIVVAAVADAGLSNLLSEALPGDHSLIALLAITYVSAVLSNLTNNLPATLLLLPLVAPLGTTALLAMLIGVNVGPNATYVGSLATLLWRGVLRRDGTDAPLGEFTLIGLATTIPALALGTTALWLTS